MTESKSNSRRGPRLKPGEIFEGKYRLVEKLGTGSFAVVVKARHETMGRDVALKLLKPSVLKSNPEVSDRFIKEVQIVSKLRHPNTVTIYDFGEARGIHYMVLEYLEGVTLDRLTTHGPIEESRAIGICHQILKSLAEAHAIGIIHRDLKPSNIMLCEMHGETDFVKVLDFGVAKLLEESETVVGGDGNKQRSTQFIGTPVYMSPEQVLGRTVGSSSDLYSLGLIFYEMLTGEPPMEIDSVASVARLHLSSEPLPFSRIDSLSPQIRDLILKATSREPADRFQSVAEFAEALPLPGAVESVEKVEPQAEAEQAVEAESSPDESFEDMFSGQNYLDPFEVESTVTDEREATRSTTGSKSRSEPAFDQSNGGNPGSGLHSSRAGGGSGARPIRPSTRPEELDIDMGSVKRQQIEAERKKNQSSRSVDGTYETREYFVRAATYLAGIVAFYLAFMLTTASLSTATVGTRWVAGGLIPVAAVVWTVFSGVRAIGEDVGRTWLLPTARNFVYILGVVIAITAFASPAETAAGLSRAPAWFLEPFSDTPLLSSVHAITVKLGHALAEVYAELDQLLPY